MAIEVNVPDIGDFKDVPVITVLVKVGDTIAAEDPLIELESDKATMEVPSPVAGRIAAISVKVGDRVSEGALILTVEAEGVTAADAPAQDAPKQNIPDRPAPAAGSAAAPVAAAPAGGAITDSGFGKAHASPSVRAFARQLGVDLGRINGSGRKGRILREDVAAALKASAAPVAAAPTQGGMGIPPIPVIDFSKFGPVENVEMARIKKLSGPALHRSWLNVPHVTHNEGVLKVLPKILVNLTAKVEDLVEGLAAALKSARECVKESHYAFTTFPVSRSSFCETTRLTPSACIETP